MDREELQARLARATPMSVNELYNLALDALDHGLGAEIISRVQHALATKDDHRLWQVLGLAWREQLDAAAAHKAFCRAAALAPTEPLIAHSAARTALEAGLAAAEFYQRAKALAPNNGDILIGECTALLAQGDADAAIRRMKGVLAANPGWHEGHAAFARLSVATGGVDTVSATIDAALARFPNDPSLWRTKIKLLWEGRAYQAAYKAARHAAAQFGSDADWTRIAANCLSELGEAEAAKTLFDQLPENNRAVDLIYLIRNFIRLGDYSRALRLTERRFSSTEERQIWPYRAILWRLHDDPRWAWLEGDERLIGIFDLQMQIGDLVELAETLRAIHARSGQMLDQSVRGGTQTDGHLLARREPAIRRLSTVLSEAVAAHIAQLPSAVPNHPTLIERRAPLRFAGAWSVRLSGDGFHIDHVHPMGWFSSAFYVTVPQDVANTDVGSDDRSGWLAFGECRDLLPTLEGFRFVKPIPGRLILFPSTMWHGTRPFAAGERMTVAFDVAIP